MFLLIMVGNSYFANGIFLLSLDSLSIGDYIKINETEGTIELIGARTLTIRTLDGAVHIIPNSVVKELVNYSRHKFNIFVDLPVKANQDIDKVLKAADDALKQLQKIPDYADILFPGSEVNGIENFANLENMIVRVTITTYPNHRWEIARKYRLLVKKEFEKHKILFA